MRYQFITLSLLLWSSTVFAQNFHGIALYQSKANINIELDSSNIPKERHAAIKEMMRKQLEKTFELRFTKTTSIYKEEERLAKPGGGRNIGFFGFGNGVFYKNTKAKTYTNQTELFSKTFLIKDSLLLFKWQLENETKMIGEHLCFKATTEKEIPDIKMGGRKNKESKDVNEPIKMKTIKVTAWYTPDIPINNGPNEYWGLPGLILELDTDRLQLLCTKIVLNPKDYKVITEPTKGKKVSQKEFDSTRNKKIKEMKEMYGGRRGKRGQMMEIMRN